MDLTQGLREVGGLDVEATRREAQEAGYATFVLPAEGIVDRSSFFDAVRVTLPLDPPLVGSRSWDAFSDSLWQGLYTHPEGRVAILWPNARIMATAASSDFEMALAVIDDVATSLADPRATRGSTKDVVVIVDSLEPL